MASLKIRTFRGGGTDPETTITIPLSILRVAAKFIPQGVLSPLQDKGIDVKMIVELSRQKEIKGTLVEIEEHKDSKKTVISVE